MKANNTRKEFIVRSLLSRDVRTVGVYRLIMKQGSDNFRSSAVQTIIDNLLKNKVNVIIYEPTLNENIFNGCSIENNINIFKNSVILLSLTALKIIY